MEEFNFIGEYERSLDNKIRTSLPAKFKPGFGDKVYIHHPEENSLLFLYPENLVGDYFNNLPIPLDPDFNLEDLLKELEKLKVVSIDKKVGRIILGIEFKDYLEDEELVYFIGAGKYVLLYLGSKHDYNNFVASKKQKESSDQ